MYLQESARRILTIRSCDLDFLCQSFSLCLYAELFLSLLALLLSNPGMLQNLARSRSLLRIEPAIPLSLKIHHSQPFKSVGILINPLQPPGMAPAGARKASSGLPEGGLP